MSVDAKSFAALDEKTRAGLVWVFAHRFHAEFNVAGLLAPFLLAAPDYDVQLLLATQVADEHRHIESVVRVYSEVFGIEGGIGAVKALADAQIDPVAASLYEALDGVVRALEQSRDEDAFLRAVVAYHLLAEGSIGRANQTFVAGAVRSGRFLSRPAGGATAGGARRGAPHRHRRLVRPPAPRPRRPAARALISELVDAFRELGENLLESTSPELAATSSRPTAPTRRRSGPRCNASSSSAYARSGSPTQALVVMM